MAVLKLYRAVFLGQKYGALNSSGTQAGHLNGNTKQGFYLRAQKSELCLFEVIRFNCIAHPFCASFFA